MLALMGKATVEDLIKIKNVITNQFSLKRIAVSGIFILSVMILVAFSSSGNSAEILISKAPYGHSTSQSFIETTILVTEESAVLPTATSLPASLVDTNVGEKISQTDGLKQGTEKLLEYKEEIKQNVIDAYELQSYGDQAADFEGKVLNKIDAAKFFSEGKEVTVVGVGQDYFDVQLDGGEKIRVLSPVKPKYHKRFINEYGLSDIKITNGFEVGYTGVLKSSQAPQANMGIGTRLVDVTPMASDGILVQEVFPLFTLYTPAVVGPNDYLIQEEMDYDPKTEMSSTKNKRWFEIFRGLTKGKIWTIFEQSNRYFTNVDKREWDRMTPGRIFDMMLKFEYLIQIPDRILTIRTPKYISTEEKFKNRYVLHDYSVKDISIRLLIPTYIEMENAITLKKTSQSEDEVSYKSINTVLKDEEMGDGEKFTWNNPIKIVLVINGKEFTIYMPTQAIIEINGKQYKLPPNLIH